MMLRRRRERKRLNVVRAFRYSEIDHMIVKITLNFPAFRDAPGAIAARRKPLAPSRRSGESLAAAREEGRDGHDRGNEGGTGPRRAEAGRSAARGDRARAAAPLHRRALRTCATE